MSLIDRLKQIPELKNRNIRLYYIFSFIHEAYFTEGNWIFLFLIFFNYQQLGILDAFAIGLGFLLEIPTGALADLIGRKRTIQLSFLIMVIAVFMIALAESQAVMFIGNLLFFVGMPLYSGAGDALAYDTMVESGTIKSYDRMYSFSRILKQISFVMAVLIGGWVVNINPRLPFILWGLFLLVGLVYSMQLTEPIVAKIKFSWKNYLRQNLIGFKELFKPAIKPYFAFILILLGMDFMYGWGFIKPAILLSFQLSAVDMGLIFAASGLLSLFILQWLPGIRKKISDFQGIVLAALIYALCFLAFSSNVQWIGVATAILMPLAGVYGYTMVTIIVNEHTLSEYRATTLSTVAMLLKIPLVMLAPLSGAIVQNGQLKPALLIFALVMIIVTTCATIRHTNLLRNEPKTHA